MTDQVRFIRRCGHPNDWTLFLVDMEGKPFVFCLGCAFKKIGLDPCEIYPSVEEMLKAFGGAPK